MRRALGLIEAGVDGIEIYETEALARWDDHRWVLPLFGNAEKLRGFLTQSNITACYPLTAASVMYGHDNHSQWHEGGWHGWNVRGHEGNSL